MCGNSEASGASGALIKRGVPSRLTLPVSQWRNALWKQTITSRVVDAEAEYQIGTALERLVRDGARRMLERALTAEVDEFLGRQRYARGGDLRGYRNGLSCVKNLARSPCVARGDPWALPQLVAAAGQVGGLGGVAGQVDGFVVGRA
jgi:hypothetical protein